MQGTLQESSADPSVHGRDAGRGLKMSCDADGVVNTAQLVK